jgi:hypothetical protein
MGLAVRLPADIDAIVESRQPVIRNLLITQRYHDLSQAMRQVVSSTDANWSTFATWASKTAGQTIRNEEVPPVLRTALSDWESLVERVSSVLRMLPGDIDPLAPVSETLRDLSGAISKGNLKVFRELGPEFSRFVATMGSDSEYDERKLRQYQMKFRPGPVDEGGQDLLRQAFTHYYEARFEHDRQCKARLIYLSNTLIGLHEQSRLQPEISLAMNAPVVDLLFERWMEFLRAVVPDAIEPQVAVVLRPPLRALGDAIAGAWRQIATRFVMELTLPFGKELPLGEDIPPDSHLPTLYPPSLAKIDEPPALFEMWARYDRPGDDTAARDWAVLDDRMNYIINLFRSRQEDEDLFVPPFNAAQTRYIEERQVPPLEEAAGL